MPNMSSNTNPNAGSSSMPRTRGPVAMPTGTTGSSQAPMLGQNVNLSVPAPSRPVSVPEQVMMQAMMRRMGRM
jgi:hypothetical protein